MIDEIIVRTNIALKPYDMEELRRSILKQAEGGVIVIPRYCEILHPNEMILEKIREEIDTRFKEEGIENTRFYYDVLEIIDKYTKGE